MEKPTTLEEALIRIDHLEKIEEAMSDVLHEILNECAGCPAAIKASRSIGEI